MSKMTIRNLIIDITGVLYESGIDKPIAGSIEAIRKLSKSDFQFVFLTNETERTRRSLVEKLNKIGFQVNEDQIISPGLVCRRYLEQHQLRPHLLISPRKSHRWIASPSLFTTLLRAHPQT
jgi:ribonucleotide monophosphatase NagD (HAD superfamily)